MIIKIGQSKYYVFTSLTLDGLADYEDVLEKTGDKKRALAGFMRRNVKPPYDVLPSIEDFLALPDEVVEQYVSRLAQQDYVFQEAYDKTSEAQNVEGRFLQAIQQYSSNKFTEMARLARGNAMELNQGLLNYAAEMSKQITSMNLDLKLLSDTVVKTSQVMTPIMEVFLERFSQIGKHAFEAIRNLQISKEEQQKRIESYTRWGQNGWTRLPEAPIGFFNACPDDKADMDALAQQFSGRASMENLFKELKLAKVKQDDLEEAIFCFRNRKYKSCALVLCSMLEAAIFHESKKVYPERLVKNVPTGIGALDRVKESKSPNAFLHFALLHVGVFACLEVMFARGDGFVSEPSVVNRNFLAHGMSKRRTRRRDCVQLFLVLYNLHWILHELG